MQQKTYLLSRHMRYRENEETATLRRPFGKEDPGGTIVYTFRAIKMITFLLHECSSFLH